MADGRMVVTVHDWLGKMMPDPEKWAEQFAAHPVASRPIVMPMGEPLNVPRRPGESPFTRSPEPSPLDAALIIKAASYIVIPNELLMDYGVIPDTRPPLPPAPWRDRFRNKVTDWRERAARRAYKIIAGDWPDDGEDDW